MALDETVLRAAGLPASLISLLVSITKAADRATAAANTAASARDLAPQIEAAVQVLQQMEAVPGLATQIGDAIGRLDQLEAAPKPVVSLDIEDGKIILVLPDGTRVTGPTLPLGTVDPAEPQVTLTITPASSVPEDAPGGTVVASIETDATALILGGPNAGLLAIEPDEDDEDYLVVTIAPLTDLKVLEFTIKGTRANYSETTKNVSVEVQAAASPANRPAVSTAIPAQNLTVGADGRLDLTGHITDPDGDDLDFDYSGGLPTGVVWNDQTQRFVVTGATLVAGEAVSGMLRGTDPDGEYDERPVNWVVSLPVDDTAPVLSEASFDDTTAAATFTTTKGGTPVWAVHANAAGVPVLNSNGSWTGATIEAGSGEIPANGAGTFEVPYTVTTGERLTYGIIDAAGNVSNLITVPFTPNVEAVLSEPMVALSPRQSENTVGSTTTFTMAIGDPDPEATFSSWRKRQGVARARSLSKQSMAY